MDTENIRLLHNIDKKVDVLEERTKALEEIKIDLRSLRTKLEAQTAKQAATSATIAIITSLLFWVIKSNYELPSRVAVPHQSASKAAFSVQRTVDKAGYR
jgi:hypothetical protein